MNAAAPELVFLDNQAMKFPIAVEAREEPLRKLRSQRRRRRLIRRGPIRHVFKGLASDFYIKPIPVGPSIYLMASACAAILANDERYVGEDRSQRIGPLLQSAPQPLLIKTRGVETIQIPADRLGRGLGVFQITVQLL